MRAERIAQLGLLRAIHPDRVTPVKLMSAVTEELNADDGTTTDIRNGAVMACPASRVVCMGYWTTALASVTQSMIPGATIGLVVDLQAPLFVLRRAEGGGSLSEKEVAHSLAVSASASVLRESTASD